MGGVLVAKAAILFGFHTVWMVLFFLGGIVVALLAVLTSQCNLCTHEYPSLSYKIVKILVEILYNKKTPPPDVWQAIYHKVCPYVYRTYI